MGHNSRMGTASQIISIAIVLISAVFIVLGRIGIIGTEMAIETKNMVVRLWFVSNFIIAVVALGLGLAGLFRKGKRKIKAIIGMSLSIVIIVGIMTFLSMYYKRHYGYGGIQNLFFAKTEARPSWLFQSFSPVSIMHAKNLTNENIPGALTFLRDGQLWIADHRGKNGRPFIKTSGKIKDYIFSRDLQYLAYHGTLGKGAGIFAIMETEKRSVRYERKIDVEKEAIHLIKWVPNNKLYFTSIALKTEYGAIGAPSVFDVQVGEEEGLYGHATDIIDSDDENTIAVYYTYKEGKQGLLIDQLRLADLKSKSDKVIYAVDRGVGGVSIQEPKISNTKKYIAFTHDCRELFVYCMATDRGARFYSGSVMGPILWSPDDKSLLFYTAQDKAVVLNIQNPANIKFITGKSFTWHSEGRLLYEKNENIYRYDVATDKTELMLKKAYHPVYLEYSKESMSFTSDSYGSIEQTILSDKNIDQSKLLSVDKKQLWLLRNTVFARHGRSFSHENLQNWFQNKSWYKAIQIIPTTC